MFSRKTKKGAIYDYPLIFKHLISRLSQIQKNKSNFSSLLSLILDTVGSKQGSLFLYHSDRNVFLLSDWVGQKPLSLNLSADYEFLVYIKKQTQICFKDEFLSQSKNQDIRSAAAHYFTQLSASALIPLNVQDRWVGLLHIDRQEQKTHFDEADRSFFELLSHWLSQALVNWDLIHKVKKQNKKLEEIDRLKSQLMSNITHELRTPLNAVLGLSEVILSGDDGPLNDQQAQHLQMIHDAGQNLLDIIDNVIHLTKAESKEQSLSVKKLSLSRLISDMEELFSKSLHINNNQFKSHVSDDLSVYVDEDQIRSVLMNLMSNANKFTHKGQIEIFADRRGEMLRVCVKDTGQGIQKKDQRIIFDKFRQADNSMTRQEGGSGLGLALSKKIIELHGGRIWVESVPEKGSEFYFTLPMTPAALQSQDLR